MEKLISLSDLITRQKIHQIELIDEIENPKSKIAKLYHFEHDSNTVVLYRPLTATSHILRR